MGRVIGQLVGTFVLGMVIGVVQILRARRRRFTVASGGTARIATRLTLAEERPRRGRLELSAARAIWRARSGGGLVDLGGAVVLSAVPPTGGSRGDVLVRVALPSHTTISLTLSREDAAMLVEVLRGSRMGPAGPAVPRLPGRRPRWAISCLVIGTLWMALLAWLAFAGYATTATVTGNDGEGFCTVVWEHGGEEQRGEVDCDSERPGARLAVRVFAWPDAGDPWQPGTAVAAALMFGLPLCAAGAARLLVLRSRPLRPAPASRPMWAGRALDLPDLSPEDLVPVAGEPPAAVVARLALLARQQVPDHGWERSGRPLGVTGPLTRARLGRLLWPLTAVVCLLVVTGPWLVNWYALQTSVTATTTAVAADEQAADVPWPLPQEATVSYRGASEYTITADVPVDSALSPGDRVTVQYVVDDPRTARLTGADDGLTRGAGLGAVGLLPFLLWSVLVARSLVRHVQGVHAARRYVARFSLGVLTSDSGGPVVLACDPLLTPIRFVAVPLETPLPHGTAERFAAGTELQVYGPLRDGALVVLALDGLPAPLFPRGAATGVDAARLLALLDSAGQLTRDADEE